MGFIAGSQQKSNFWCFLTKTVKSSAFDERQALCCVLRLALEPAEQS
mgnify:CR=1 FL=1